MRHKPKKHQPLIIVWAVLAMLLCIAPATEAVVGIPDQVPAATLLVPFFEVGVSSGEGTLLVVAHVSSVPSQVVHATIWDRDGTPRAAQDITIAAFSEWHISMSAWLDALEVFNPGLKASLQVGAYYWGYVTFDSVTAATALDPIDAGYPFSPLNYLTGWIYYIDLLQGKTNGLSMVPIEAVGDSASPPYQKGFYDTSDAREEISPNSRYVVKRASEGNSLGTAYSVQLWGRFFQQEVFDATSRVVIWRYRPSVHGATPITCDSAYIKSETGAMVQPTISLDHVVNVIDIGSFTTRADYPAGWISLSMNEDDVTYPQGHGIYGFTINSANYQASLNWMAIFEMQVYAWSP